MYNDLVFLLNVYMDMDVYIGGFHHQWKSYYPPYNELYSPQCAQCAVVSWFGFAAPNKYWC